MREIWTDSVVEENNLNQNISVLRRIFDEKPGEQRFIVTVAGHGYRFVPEVRAIADHGSGIAIIGTDEIVRQNTIAGRGSYQTKDASPSTRSGIQSRRWFAVFSVASLLSLGAAGFYFWRGNTGSTDSAIKTIAVLPFKPLVSENRNDALELGMAESLIAKLSGSQEVAVRPLSSVRKEALISANKAKELSRGNPLATALAGYALAKLGRDAEARASIAELMQARYVQPYTVALVYNGLRERDQALELLERGYRERDPGMTFLKVDNKWNELRVDARFIDLMARMNLQ